MLIREELRAMVVIIAELIVIIGAFLGIKDIVIMAEKLLLPKPQPQRPGKQLTGMLKEKNMKHQHRFLLLLQLNPLQFLRQLFN